MKINLIRFNLIFIAFLLSINFLIGQEGASSTKGYLYASWGYNRNFYTTSDISFISEQYNFTLRDVKASDRPQALSFDNYLNPKNLSIPQYSFRFGYYLTDNIHISAGMDHMKYVVNQNQSVLIDGFINSKTNTQYNGDYNSQWIEIKKGFLEFEHTNGLNLVTIQADYAFSIAQFFNNKFRLRYNVGIGGIWVGTKSDVRILDEGIDNDHHLAGYSLCVQTGPRLEFNKLVYLDIQSRGGYIYLNDIFIENELAPKRASQAFGFLNYSASIGVMIPIKKMFK